MVVQQCRLAGSHALPPIRSELTEPLGSCVPCSSMHNVEYHKQLVGPLAPQCPSLQSAPNSQVPGLSFLSRLFISVPPLVLQQGSSRSRPTLLAYLPLCLPSRLLGLDTVLYCTLLLLLVSLASPRYQGSRAATAHARAVPLVYPTASMHPPPPSRLLTPCLQSLLLPPPRPCSPGSAVTPVDEWSARDGLVAHPAMNMRNARALASAPLLPGLVPLAAYMVSQSRGVPLRLLHCHCAGARVADLHVR